MTREERDRAIADIRARLELDVRTARGFDLPSSMRWYEGKLVALDSLIASERQGRQHAAHGWQAALALASVYDEANVAHDARVALAEYAHELAGGDGG